MCKLIKITQTRKEIINKFPIADRDNYIYKNIEEAVKDSLRRAFKDFNFRTLKKKSNNYPKLTENTTITNFLIEELNSFIKKFVDYFSNKEDDFDKWHHEACEEFLDVLIKYYPDAKYGKAQKIVNMMFKYLYCMNFGDKDSWVVLDEDYFSKCHLTLDSFTLEWFYREVVENWYNKKDSKQRGAKIYKTKFDSWSNLEYQIPERSYEDYAAVDSKCKAEDNCRLIKNEDKYFYHYMFFVTIVRKYFVTTTDPTDEQKRYLGKTPFQAEFYIWPDIQMHLTAEALFGQSIGQEQAIAELESVTHKRFTDFNEAQKYYRNLDRKTKGIILIKKLEFIDRKW